MSDLKEDGIHIQRHKTAGSSGKRTVYAWTPHLREIIDQVVAARPCVSPFLFCNKFGKGYVNEVTGKAGGWGSMWGRMMEKLLATTKVTQRFTEHDLRAKAASDAPTLEQATALLSHSDPSTTQTIYRRKAEKVTPLDRRKTP